LAGVLAVVHVAGPRGRSLRPSQGTHSAAAGLCDDTGSQGEQGLEEADGMRSALISIVVATRIAVSMAWPQGRPADAPSRAARTSAGDDRHGVRQEPARATDPRVVHARQRPFARLRVELRRRQPASPRMGRVVSRIDDTQVWVAAGPANQGLEQFLINLNRSWQVRDPCARPAPPRGGNRPETRWHSHPPGNLAAAL